MVEGVVNTWSNCSGWAEPYLEKSLEKEIYPDVFVLADMTQAVTRAEFASVAVLFYQALTGDQVKLDEEQENPFSDVTADPQAWENGYLEHMQCPNGEQVIMPSSPISMDSVGTVVTTAAAKTGAHTAQVLARLGYTPEQIAQMTASGAVYCLKEGAE